MAGYKPPKLGPVTPGPDIDIRLAPPEFEFPPWWNAARDLLEGVSENAAKRQLATTGEGSVIPVTVGRDKVGARLVDVFVSGSKLILVCVWGDGEYQAVEKVYIGDEEFTGTARHYLGGNVEPLDPLFAARGLAQNYQNVCFSVLEFAKDTPIALPSAIVQGRVDIWDPRLSGGSGAEAYSPNASLVLGWFVKEILGETINQTDLETCADFNDEALGTLSGSEVEDRGKHRRRIGLTAERPQKIGKWLSVYQEYAQVFISREGSEVRMIPSEDATPVASIGPGDVIAGSFVKSIAGLARVPNRVTVIYTDINGSTWVDKPYRTPLPVGVAIREQRVSMPGIQSLAQATRYGIERLNKYTLARLSGSFLMRDDGLKYLRGEIVSLTDVEGAVAKAVRILDVKTQNKGEWSISYVEHDPAIQDTTVVDEPSVSDTNLPNPNNVPDVTGLDLSISEPQFKSGIYYSSIRATWAELADYPFERSFEVVFKQTGAIVGSVMTTELEATFGPLAEGLTYEVEVIAIGVFGARSANPGTTDPLLVTGKTQVPTNVPNFTAFGVGGEVRLKWDSSVDNVSIWRYEIRYGAPGVTWAAATFLTRVDSLAHTTTELAAGTWDILIKAIDNAFNESTSESRAPNVEVDQSSDIFLLDSIEAGHSNSVGMRLLQNGDYVVDSNETWDSLFPGLMDSYTSEIYSYQTPGPASYTSADLDPAVGDVSGSWQGSTTVTVVSGSPTQELELYNGSTWEAQGASSVVAEAQKARWKMSGAAGAVFVVRPPTTIRLDVFARAENGSEQTIGGGEATANNPAGTQLTDSGALFQTDGVAIGDVVKNLTTGAKATISSIPSETAIGHGTLSGGSRATWVDGDLYAVGVKITTADTYSALKSITFTPNNASAPVSFEPDDITLGDPTSFLVFGFDTFNEEVGEPFLWKLEGV